MFYAAFPMIDGVDNSKSVVGEAGSGLTAPTAYFDDRVMNGGLFSEPDEGMIFHPPLDL
jgi:hypothetical protein